MILHHLSQQEFKQTTMMYLAKVDLKSYPDENTPCFTYSMASS